MVAAGFSLTDAASRLHARFAGACGCLGFRHRGNTSLTSGCGIFTMAEHMSARAPIFAPGESSVIYWVAYQRGSFSVKERYLCPDQARSRCSDLITEARYIRIIPTEEAELQLLNQCFELPAIS